ncbi:helix-turn-helix domain-containing protein [Spirosoma agri]|uniref:Helix-turn-helix transcriptional regulator n=1 Tax=Spirosoma agri TaxID=1987381 RepID=A0A6M0IK63_9BACT|nr:helix-turn-helix transcriptional regulator [Spirosoma agri]NEU67771.1 helix-turn-helix transcriptional regulator [Spirosoma agri]
MNTPKEIGDYIKQLRKLKGLTQAELAVIIGVKTATYTHFETGRTNMTLATINKIADALGYDLQVAFSLKKPAEK